MVVVPVPALMLAPAVSTLMESVLSVIELFVVFKAAPEANCKAVLLVPAVSAVMLMVPLVASTALFRYTADVVLLLPVLVPVMEMLPVVALVSPARDTPVEVPDVPTKLTAPPVSNALDEMPPPLVATPAMFKLPLAVTLRAEGVTLSMTSLKLIPASPLPVAEPVPRVMAPVVASMLPLPNVAPCVPPEPVTAVPAPVAMPAPVLSMVMFLPTMSVLVVNATPPDEVDLVLSTLLSKKMLP